MNTKLTGDIAEQAVILKVLQKGWGVLRPVGDRLPYDLVLDISGRLLRIQVKAAWFDSAKGNFVIDNRRTKMAMLIIIKVLRQFWRNIVLG